MIALEDMPSGTELEDVPHQYYEYAGRLDDEDVHNAKVVSGDLTHACLFFMFHLVIMDITALRCFRNNYPDIKILQCVCMVCIFQYVPCGT